MSENRKVVGPALGNGACSSSGTPSAGDTARAPAGKVPVVAHAAARRATGVVSDAAGQPKAVVGETTDRVHARSVRPVWN